MIKLHIFELAFNRDTSEAHLPSNHAAHRDPDVPHLSGGWIILAKEKCSLTGSFNGASAGKNIAD